MKTFKFFATMMMVALCVGFTSCGSDDENNDNTKPNTKLISKIIYQGNGSKDWVEAFQYDAQGRVTQLTSGDAYCSYVYNEKTIVATIKDGSENYTITYKLENGLIASQQNTFDDGYVEYTYNSSKQLKKMHRQQSDYTELYEWTNTNLVSISAEDWHDTYTYTYNQYKNNATIDLNGFVTEYDVLEEEASRGLEKYFGILSTNLVEKYMSKDSSKGDYLETLKYEFDKDGCVTKCIVTKKGVDRVRFTVEYYK